jgi:thiamine biosynthesis lipoprotein
MVDVGGDLRCFGRPPSGDKWSVRIRDPFSDGVFGEFELEAGAVCTSGGYARFRQIDARRYGHIIDPRTGRPADAAASATVVAPRALMADVWGTALCILGTEGLAQLPKGTDALLILGTRDDHQTVGTSGFARLFTPTNPSRPPSF